MEYIFLLVIGFLAGTIGSLVGLGGGVIIVPALLFFRSCTCIASHFTTNGGRYIACRYYF